MAKVNVSVSIKEEHQPRFTEFVDRIRKTGLEIDQEHKSVGVVTGNIDSEKVRDLEKLNEVAHVEEIRGVKIAPPGSKIQ